MKLILGWDCVTQICLYYFVLISSLRRVVTVETWSMDVCLYRQHYFRALNMKITL